MQSSDQPPAPAAVRGPEEIENERIQTLKDIEAAEKNAATVRERMLWIDRCILLMSAHKKKIGIEWDKVKHNIKVLKVRAERLEVEFWKNKP